MTSIANTHRNYSHDWWTPPEWMHWVQRTLGDFRDPCPRDWDGINELKTYWPIDIPHYINHPGARGYANIWWDHAMAWLEEAKQHGRTPPGLVWCAFNVESLRHLHPSPLALDGWLVFPRVRTSFIWGGPTTSELSGAGAHKKGRVHGEPMTSPGNHAVWWTNVKPAKPPEVVNGRPQVSTVVKTGWTLDWE